MPRHVNPTSSDRPATAPYNFVPLPQRVFEVADGIEVAGEKIKPPWEMHDHFVPGTNSGSIELTIETLTPLFIRGAVSQRQDGAWDDRDSRLRPDPYTTPDGRPAIPGSSLRGMVRTLVEILSFSKIQPVDAGRPFFRTVAPDRIGRAYGERMRHGSGVRGGRLQRQGNDWSIVACEVLRVKRSILPSGVHQGNRPSWAHQQKRCWVDVDGHFASSIVFAPDAAKKPGHLVLTGDVPGKKREFVFLDPAADPEGVVVPQNVWDRFHDDDQVTQWQKTAFPRDQPQGRGRPAPGHLRDGEPVFFLADDDAKSDDNPNGVVFLGRAGMFRLPYDRSPADLVQRELREARLDLAEVMFGKVDQSGAIKGRVYFEDAIATTAGPDAFEAPLVPGILSAPKPTTFQHYLTQDGAKGKDQLTTYLAGDRTTIRGHKLYWHRDDGSGVLQAKEGNNHNSLLHDLRRDEPHDTQHTVIRPVRTGVTFVGSVRFENLTDLELGALLHALQLPDGCAHRLGMGKPLGLGSVQITAHVRTVDRAARYGAWQSSGIQDDEDGDRFRSAFGAAILAHARASEELLLNDQQGLRQVARLDVLFRILDWTNRPALGSTAYMDLRHFRERPVLPTPHSVTGANEPPWPADPSRPALGGQGDSGTSSGRRGHTRDRRVAVDTRSRSQVAPPLPKPIEKGQTRSGTLKRSGGHWVAVFDGDLREAQVINPHKIDPSRPEGATAEFYITAQSKSVGIKCRFEN